MNNDDLLMLELQQAPAATLEEHEQHAEKAEADGGPDSDSPSRMRRFGPWFGGAFVGGMAALLLAFSLVYSLSKGEPAGQANVSPGPSAPQTNASSAPPTPTRATPANDQTALSDLQRAELAKRMQETALSSNLEIGQAAPALKVKKSEATTTPPSSPMILRTAQVTLVTPDLDRARTGMDQIVHQFGGYVGDLAATASADGQRKLTATLRIPAGQLDAALAEVKKLGKVESEAQTGQDVTAQYVDLEARLNNARNTEQRLIELLNQRTGKLSDVLEVETELSRVREEIERMEGERRLLSKQVDFATVTATIAEEYKASARPLPDSVGTRFRNAAVDGYQSVIDFVLGVAIFLISSGPILLIWFAILFFPVRWGWRKWRSFKAPA